MGLAGGGVGGGGVGGGREARHVHGGRAAGLQLRKGGDDVAGGRSGEGLWVWWR